MLDARLLRRARAARLVLALDVALALVGTLLLLVQATLLADVVARAFDGAPLHALTLKLGALAAVFAVRGGLSWSVELAGRHAASTVLSELRLELAEQRLRRQPSALDGTESAEVAAAAVQGVDALAVYFGRCLPQLVLATVAPVVVLAYVMSIDVIAALVMLVTLPLVPVFMWLIGRYTEERTRERWDALRLLSVHFADVVRGLPTLRAFNRSRAQTELIATTSDRYRRTTMGTLRVAFISGSVLELAATLGVALVAVTIGVRLADGGLGLRAGLTVLVLAPELYRPLRELGAQFHASADGLAVAERIFGLLDAPAAVGPGGERAAPSPAAAPVRLEGVSFAYPSRPGLALDDVDLELDPGELVALVGESGAGKSTVAALLLRLAEPSRGRITAGGVDLAQCRSDAWRRQIAWVPQRPTLFHGTVADNIRLGAPSAPDGRVRAAAALAGADRFVALLPQGLDTVLGEGGRTLSSGERRRVALARAILRDAPLLILDEPTADLDPESAQVVAETLDRLRRPTQTILVIAHRPELAAQADRAVVLSRGRVVEPARREAA
jgi:thiol reductant ABC exporter CydD subunit